MERNIKNAAFNLIMVGLLLLVTSSNMQYASYEGLAIISHTGSTPLSLSQKEFDKLIHGEKQRWDGGKTVSIALLKTSHPMGQKTAKEIFDMNGNELNRYWLGLVFEGKSKGPEFFQSEEELINYVAITPGAVGVISSSTKSSKVTFIKID